MYRTYGVKSICIVLLLRHKYSASLQHRMLVALVFRHLRYFGPSGRIGPISTYQLTKKLKFWLTKGNASIKLLVYTIFYYSPLIQLGMYSLIDLNEMFERGGIVSPPVFSFKTPNYISRTAQKASAVREIGIKSIGD